MYLDTSLGKTNMLDTAVSVGISVQQFCTSLMNTYRTPLEYQRMRVFLFDFLNIEAYHSATPNRLDVVRSS